jgi:hypothetical protein
MSFSQQGKTKGLNYRSIELPRCNLGQLVKLNFASASLILQYTLYPVFTTLDCITD